MSAVELLPFPFDGDGVRAVVTTRHGGTSTGGYAGLNLGDHVGDDPAAVRRNRELLAQALGVTAITLADQQHGDQCKVVTKDLAGRGFTGSDDARQAFSHTDALVTDVPGTALGVLVADCAPIVLHDPVRAAVGVVHAGRPGVLADVVAGAVSTMTTAFGTRPADLRAGIGPCIGFESYEVGDAEADPLEALFPGAGFVRATRPGHQLFDVGGAVERQLQDAGVPAGSVHRMRVDTRHATDRFYSHRAERPTGRFLAVISLGPRR